MLYSMKSVGAVVTKVRSDLEATVWQTFRHVFSATLVQRRCVFH